MRALRVGERAQPRTLPPLPQIKVVETEAVEMNRRSWGQMGNRNAQRGRGTLRLCAVADIRPDTLYRNVRHLLKNKIGVS